MGTHPTFSTSGPSATYQPKTTDESDDTDAGGVVSHVRGKMDQISDFQAVTFDSAVAVRDGLWVNSAGAVTVTVNSEDHTITMGEGPHKMRITNVKSSGTTVLATNLKYFTLRALLALGLLAGAFVDPASAQTTVRGNAETFGAVADPVCTTDDGVACTMMALIKRTNARLTALIGQFTDTLIGSAPPTNANYIAGTGSGATGGLIAGIKTCDTYAKYDAAATGSKTLVTGISGRKVYVCGYILSTSSTATTVKLSEGSDANCATANADLTPGIALVANDRFGAKSAFWDGLATSTNGYFVCITSNAANAHQAQIWYTIQ